MSKRPDASPILGTLGKNKVYNWNGWKIVVGHGKSTGILDEIQYRRRNVKQNAMVIVGPPGEGKSYFALRLAQILDPKFDPYLQIVFERTNLLWLIGSNSPLKMGQVIIIDEAQFIAGARRWYEDIQKDVMEHIEAIRSKGYVVLIVALHLNLLDKIIRKYVLSHMILLMERGKAKVYHLWTPAFKDALFSATMGKMSLQIPDYEYCKYPNCLMCRHLERCYTIRAIYERRKRDFLGKMSTQSEKKAVLHERQKRFIDYKDLLKKVIEKKDELVFSRTGVVEPESIKILLEENHNLVIADTEARRIIKRGLIKHPDIFQHKDEKKEMK